MKKKIAILGSTGSIGESLLKIISRDKKNFQIVLITANKNYKKVLKQAKIFNVKNIIITDTKYFNIAKSITRKKKINVYNNFDILKKIFPKKIDYVMSSIVGIDGLLPTLKVIKYTKRIAIANKESIICAWYLIYNKLKKFNTDFIPVDSEHFSLWYGMKNLNSKKIEKFYLTASGGSLYNEKLDNINNVTINKALNHPNWKMGKKITIDSATMINKVFEVIEAKNIFGVKYNQIEILIHPSSYVHALIKFTNGLIKIVAHETTMRIPIFNTLYSSSIKRIASKNINIKNLNNLNFKKIDKKRYPMVKLLKILPEKASLFETIIVSANDTLVELFLNNKIKFLDIQKNLIKIISRKEFVKYKKVQPRNVNEIIKLNNYVRLKTFKKVYKI